MLETYLTVMVLLFVKTNLMQKHILLKIIFLEYLLVKICGELYLKKYLDDVSFLYCQPCLPKPIASLFILIILSP